MTDLLKKAALAWRDLEKYEYTITHGQNKIQDMKIAFSKYEFHHIAGFQYLGELNELPQIKKSGYLQAVLNDRITQSDIEKGAKYETLVKPRLLAIIDLQETIDRSARNGNDLQLFQFVQSDLPFKTKTYGDNLIFGKNPTEMFVFVDKESSDKNGAHYVCASIFLKENNDYTSRQATLRIQKITKTNLRTQEQDILIDKAEAKRIMQERTKPKSEREKPSVSDKSAVSADPEKQEQPSLKKNLAEKIKIVEETKKNPPPPGKNRGKDGLELE